VPTAVSGSANTERPLGTRWRGLNICNGEAVGSNSITSTEGLVVMAKDEGAGVSGDWHDHSATQ
jgi:hypothetical protein